MPLNNKVQATIEVPTTAQLPVLDAKSLPPQAGNNWVDTAFSSVHSRPQTLKNELSGKVFKVRQSPHPKLEPPQNCCPSAVQLNKALEAARTGQSLQLNSKCHMTLQDKILRFFAYFKEDVKESAVERGRIRHVTLTYFPVDDTILVQEPKLPNSGLPGGTLLKRHKVAATRRQREQRPADEFVNLNHLHIGADVSLHAVSYHIYDCDASTKAFMGELGIELAPAEEPPQDAFHLQRKSTETSNFGVKSETRHSAETIRAQRFMQESGKVLRFYGLWDNRDAAGGEVHSLEVSYFVEDDTVSVSEKQLTGEAVPSSFLSRRKLPLDGTMSKAVELSFSARVNGIREPFLGGANSHVYYTALDLTIGLTLNLYGRGVFLFDCDGFTRDYYRQDLGIVLPSPSDTSHFRSRQQQLPPAALPPPTGFGSEEDSLASCKSLILQAPKKFIVQGEGEVLRFEMRVHESERPEERLRRFVLSFYVDDQEAMITEAGGRNTGFTGGKFIRKQKLRKGSDEPPQYYKLEDIEVGRVVCFNKFVFDITSCDEHTRHYLAVKEKTGAPREVHEYMEPKRLQELLQGLHNHLTCRYVTLTEAFRSMDQDKDGMVTAKEMEQAMLQNMVTSHAEESLAILNHLDVGKKGFLTYSDVFSFLSSPSMRETSPRISTKETLATYQHSTDEMHKNFIRVHVLKKLKERLEGRCLNVFEMFRMISTMPRAFKGRRTTDVMALTNASKDAVITPVQVRRALDEMLGLLLSREEYESLMSFFFPLLPKEEYHTSTADVTKEHVLELKDFQLRFNEMDALCQLH